MKKPGYILVLTIMIIGLSVVIITYVSNKVTAYSPFAHGLVEQEKAHELALAGVQIALSQLAGMPQTVKPEGQKQDEAKDAVSLLKTILPIKNQWQEFVLTKARDGVTGTIQICLVSEDGKIDINELYDFEKQQFVQEEGIDVKKGLQVFFSAVEKATDGKDLFQAFEKFLKDRQYKLQDVTELLMIKEFEVFKRSVFYEPPGTVSSEKQEKSPVYLTDIFTVWSGSMQLEPWLLSHSLGVLLGFKEQKQGEGKELIEQALKQFKPEAQWKTDWDKTLAPLYGKEFKALPAGIDSFFATAFEPLTFSVLSYGKVGKITQKILAIVERDITSNKEGVHEVSIKRLYWL